MRNRFENAVYISAGACNPQAIGNSFVDACKEARAEGADLRADPALRLMAYQIAYLLNLSEFDSSLSAYGDALAVCQNKSSETAREETAAR